MSSWEYELYLGTLKNSTATTLQSPNPKWEGIPYPAKLPGRRWVLGVLFHPATIIIIIIGINKIQKLS